MIDGRSSWRTDLHAKEVNWGIKHIIVGTILVMVSLFTAATTSLMAGELYPKQEDAMATWISVHIMAIAMGVIVWYLGVRGSRFPITELNLNWAWRPQWRTILLTLGVLAASLLITAIYSKIVELLEIDVLSPPAVDSGMIFNGAGVILTFQALALITPFSEELFFRGFVFRGLIPKVGPYGGMVISAVIFSGFHLSPGVLIPIFITGFLLSWLYWRTGSLWASVGAHAGQNALALLATLLI